jgi:Flp pilus assembly protein TadD
MKKEKFIFLGMIVVVLVLFSCYGGSGGPVKSPAVGVALEAPADALNKDAAMKSDEGLSHLKQEHWDTSAGHFRDAIRLDPNLAEAHFNLGLALDQMGNHEEAAEHFRKAKELAPTNTKIVENEILKKHL